MGDIIWNFKALTIRFSIRNQHYFLQEYKDKLVSFINEEQLYRLLHKPQQLTSIRLLLVVELGEV